MTTLWGLHTLVDLPVLLRLRILMLVLEFQALKMAKTHSGILLCLEEKDQYRALLYYWENHLQVHQPAENVCQGYQQKYHVLHVARQAGSVAHHSPIVDLPIVVFV